MKMYCHFKSCLEVFLKHLMRKENLKTQDKVQGSDLQAEHLSAFPFCFNFHTFILLDQKLLPIKIGMASDPLKVQQQSQ